ncbi:helix-turn-helix domain-containing protein [Micromonospora sp. NPDC050200]|uniref:TrmB family transcriptional regulator n=1 Tax=Micromonospora sp. NPDC050200 TaxID=3155664 RepID=UPI00340981B8
MAGPDSSLNNSVVADAPSGLARSLEALHVSAFDEAVYRALLGHRDIGPPELAERVGATVTRVDRSLGRLRDLGLVSRLAGRRRRYTAADPETAIEALIRSRTADLERVRSVSVELVAAFRAAQRGGGEGDVVELVHGAEELRRWFVRLQQQVREEMLVLDRPPYALAASNPVESVILAQGVRCRAVYAPEALEIPGALEEITELARRGERGRVLPGMPLKLAIADARVALLPLSLDLETTQVALIHKSTLLDALVDLFETYWELAVPIGGDAGEVRTIDEETRQLLTLQASGLKDDAIARQLGLSIRTMRRRMRTLLDELSATNRFQAGVQAARRGWL